MKKKDIIFVVCFVAALAIGGIVTVTAGHREYSDNENRYLTQFPKLVPEDVMTGEVQQELTDAFNDQFPGRDWLTALSTTVKKGIGMKDVGGVYLGKDHYYFEKIMNQNISRTD